MPWRPDAPQGKESAKIRSLTAHYTQGRGLDVGCGREKLWPASIGVDSGKQWGQPVADITSDASDLSLFATDSMEYVFSSHVLEHVVDYRAALSEWWRVIKPGGFLVLYLPHRMFYPNVGAPGSNPDHKHDFMPEDIVRAMAVVARESGCEIVENEDRGGGNEYSFFQVYRKRDDGHMVANPWAKPEKNCLVIRYGGFGDVIQMTSILPHLKAEGYHVTINTTPDKAKVLTHNPHIDDFWTQGSGQVPDHDLQTYWKGLSARYDRVINLCEVTEGSLLAIPGRALYRAPEAARSVMMDRNYVEFIHTWAGVPGPYEPRFYSTDEEREWAWTKALPQSVGHKLVVWALSGSSINKIYPFAAGAITQFLAADPEAFVALVGGSGRQDQELQRHILSSVARHGGPKASERIAGCAGLWTPRETFSVAQVAHAVVGPETGVLNAVCSEPNRKVVLLSHSSVENLTRDWANTISLSGGNPDHRLHYANSPDMDMDPETGADVRLAAIEPDQVVEGLLA